MNYHFAKWRPALDGNEQEPDLPQGIGYLLLADSRLSEWSLYQCSYDNEKININNPVNNELKLLLYSAERFPPALALTRDDISRKFKSTNPTLSEFQSAIITSLKSRLNILSRRRFLLLETASDEIGYLGKSEWYWVIGVSKDKSSLYWISDDYFVYTNPISHFKISDEQLEILS